MKKYRVWAEVDLAALRRNVGAIRHRLSHSTKILAVIKADAYGHGAIPVARACLESGVDFLGVGDSTEAIELRESGILAPILILGAVIEEEIGWIVSYDIRPTLHSLDMVYLLNQEAHRQGKRLKVHLKVDTGMGRLGASPARALAVAGEIQGSPNLELEGLCTQFSSAYGNDPAATMGQLRSFESVCRRLSGMGVHPPLLHAANSGAVAALPSSHLNMVRPGIALYGLDPGNLAASGVSVEPVLSLKTQITFLKGVKGGTPVGYNRTHTTVKSTRIATLPVGYNDGYPYLLSNKAQCIVRNTPARVVGTVTMDYTTVDVGHIAEARVGDEVILIGSSGGHTVTVMELARLVGTIPYEIVCALGRRVRRVYVDSGTVPPVPEAARPESEEPAPAALTSGST